MKEGNFMLHYYIAQLQVILYVAPVMLLAIICHECAHGFVSDRLGDPTPRMSGRLTLNPLKHLDPIGTLCLLFFHMGWANPVPINPYYYKDRKKGIILVSLAGPAVNMLLAFVSLFIEGLFMLYGSSSSSIVQTAMSLAYYSAVLNIGLGIFNLIPVPPLDGSHVLGELSPKAAELYGRYARYWGLALILLLASGALSRPLGFLNDAVLNGMWSIIRMILLRLPQPMI